MLMMATDENPAVVIDQTQIVESSKSMSKVPNKTPSSQFMKQEEMMSINSSHHQSFHGAINNEHNDHELIVQEAGDRPSETMPKNTQDSHSGAL